MSLPRDADRAGLVPHDRDLQPGLLPGRGHALPRSSRAGTRGAGDAASGSRSCSPRSRSSPSASRPADAAGADMRRFLDVARAVAWRVDPQRSRPTRRLLLPSLDLPAVLLHRLRGRPVERRQRAGLRLPGRLHGVPVRLRLAAGVGVRRRVHRLRDRRRLRVRLRAAAAARRPRTGSGSSPATRSRRSRAPAIVGVMLFCGRAAHRHAGRRQTASTCSGSSCSPCSSTSPRRCGRRAWRCACASMQAGPLMQMPVFILLFLAPVYVPLAPARRLGPRASRRFNPFTAADRGRARLHLRPATLGARSPTGSLSGCVLGFGALGGPRPAEGGSRRIGIFPLSSDGEGR